MFSRRLWVNVLALVLLNTVLASALEIPNVEQSSHTLIFEKFVPNDDLSDKTLIVHNPNNEAAALEIDLLDAFQATLDSTHLVPMLPTETRNIPLKEFFNSEMLEQSSIVVVRSDHHIVGSQVVGTAKDASLGLHRSTATAAQITITDIGGYSDGLGVINGKWTGQGPACNNAKGKYYNYYAAESQNTSYWLIKGSGFGATKGTVKSSDSNIALRIDSWKDTEIKVIVSVRYTYTANATVTLTVTNSSKQTVKKTIPVMGIIKTRGYGQCTWYVANKRLQNNLTIPTSAYSTTGSINEKYVPQRWDCLNYGGRHVGIITSSVTKTTQKNGTVTYSFTIGEMNAGCDEIASSYSAQFIVDTIGRKVTKNIGSKAGSTFIATGYYR